MGEPDEGVGPAHQLLEPYRVTEEVMAMASKDAIFLHCRRSRHQHHHRCRHRRALRRHGDGSPTAFESKQSKVFDEAENRMHTIKAVMYATPSNLRKTR